MTKQSEFFEKLIIVWGTMLILGIVVTFLMVITLDHPALGISIILTLLVSAGVVAAHVWRKP
jgi:tryptophan-rich sensory protein